MIDENLPRYEHCEIVNALQIRALEIRCDGGPLVLHFYEDHPAAIIPANLFKGVPGLHSYMVTDDWGWVRFVPEQEFNVSYRRVVT